MPPGCLWREDSSIFVPKMKFRWGYPQVGAKLLWWVKMAIFSQYYRFLTVTPYRTKCVSIRRDHDGGSLAERYCSVVDNVWPSKLCYPRGASSARVIQIIVRLSVRLSVCVTHAGIVSKRLNVGSRKQHHVIAQGHKFSDTKIRCGWSPPSPLKSALKVTHPFLIEQFRPIFAHSALTVRAG